MIQVSGSSFAVQTTAPPDVDGWNVYCGTGPSTMTLQNATALAPGQILDATGHGVDERGVWPAVDRMPTLPAAGAANDTEGLMIKQNRERGDGAR